MTLKWNIMKSGKMINNSKVKLVLWLITGGAIIGTLVFALAIICFLAILFIPIGIHFGELALYLYNPFAKTITYKTSNPFAIILTIMWIIYAGIELTILMFVIGVIYCLTIIGIPFGLIYMKSAQYILTPLSCSIE